NSVEIPFYRKKHIHNCQAIFKSNLEAIQSAKNRSKLLERDYDLWKIFANCENVKNRNYYPTEPGSEEEAAFPLAYDILVDEDLEQMEVLLNSIYAPQNFYCLHIDLKASFLFHEALQRFAKCF